MQKENDQTWNLYSVVRREIAPLFSIRSKKVQLGFAKSATIRLKDAFVPMGGSNYTQSGEQMPSIEKLVAFFIKRIF